MTGSNSGSDDSNESRKRHSDDHFESGCSSKRPNCGASAVHLKVLIPSIAAGAVIGKDGEAIERIQKESGAKVKMSKRNDFYPGTLERVCLIVGTLEAVTSTHTFVMERIYEKPDTTIQSTDSRVVLERHKQTKVKILVPNSTAGMIIGKNGTYIQEIKERSEAYVQISQKSREFSLPERCVIVAGELHQMRAAMDLILAVIASDPQSSSCPNLSYADVRGPVSSVYPTGSPYAFPFISASTGNLLLRPDASSLATAATAAANPYLVGPLTAPLNPMDAAILLQLVNSGDHISALQQQQQQQQQHNAALNAVLHMSGGSGGSGGNGLASASGAVITANHPQVHAYPHQPHHQQQQQHQASSASPLATAVANSLGSFCSNPTFLPAAAMFDSIMPSTAAAVAAAAGPQARMTSQYLGGRGAGAFVSASAYPSVATAATAQLCPFVPLQTTAFASPSPPSSATPDAPALHAAAALAAVASANSRTTSASTSAATAASSAEALSIFDTGQRSGGGGSGTETEVAAAVVPPTGLWEESKSEAGQQPPTYLTASAAALMGLYASATAMANSNAIVTPTAGAQLLRSSVGGTSGLLYTREILVPESLIGRISGPQGRLLLDLQTQTNTLIQVSPKCVFVSGLQSRVVSISGDQMNANYAAAVIENTITIEQLNQHASVLHAPLRRPYEESGAGHINQTPGRSNGVVASDIIGGGGGDYGPIEGVASAGTSCPTQPSQPLPKQPAF
ncbi:RNA binding protein Nova 1 [Echinococcus multilocularis]|uniref:RNA binding protein Nova 1 n=1 Tax=Echinococcus multilocularis TaxID=6211 RepID=A0A068Y608_ECHMU|nr:RNA binding protein Nova 1 [Echinococcus multilocularis]